MNNTNEFNFSATELSTVTEKIQKRMNTIDEFKDVGNKLIKMSEIVGSNDSTLSSELNTTGEQINLLIGLFIQNINDLLTKTSEYITGTIENESTTSEKVSEHKETLDSTQQLLNQMMSGITTNVPPSGNN